MNRLLPVLLILALAGCGPRRLAVPDVPPPTVVYRAEASFVALGSVEAVLNAIGTDLRTKDCLDMQRARDSTGAGTLVLTDPCPGRRNRAVVRVVDAGDGTARGTVTALFSSASVDRSLAMLPAAALYRQEVPVFVVPVPEPGRASCSTVEAWRAGLDEAPRPAPLPRDTTLVEETPVLIGGIDGLVRSIRYPQFSHRAGIQGQTAVRFVVGETGEVTCAELTVGLAPDLNAEALRAVRAARFRPGTQNGRSVAVRFTIPITFRIR